MVISKVYSRCSNRARIIILILLLIGFQQFPVIFVGGSFKLYEFLGLALLLTCGIEWKRDILMILTFLFFVVSPIISLISFYICDDITSYYTAYPNTVGTFRHNVFIFPVLQLLFMMVNYVVLYNIYHCSRLYKNLDLIVKWMLMIGTGIACYSIFAMFTGDPISHLPNYIQNKHVYDFRSSGLSQEPSSYILYQGWMVLLLWYSKGLFRRIAWVVMFVLNVLALVLTFSSTLVLYVGVIGLMIFLFSRIYLKVVYVGVLAVMLWAGYLTLSRYVDVGMLNYAFVQKVEDFIFGKDDAGGSGGFRHYESTLGWIIFNDNPIVGVGVGNSSYFMHSASKKSPIIPMGEQLTENSFPPNTYSCVFAEQGVLGGTTFIALLMTILYKSWRYRNDKYGKLFLTGVIFNMGCLLMIAPQYSMYLWVFLFMSMSYMRYAGKMEKLRKYNQLINQKRLK